MSRLRTNVATACVCALLACATEAGGAAAANPRVLLASVPASTTLTTFVLQGVLGRRPGADRWRVLVNDVVVLESSAEGERPDTPIGLALILREGDNLIAIESVARSKIIERWTTHIYRTSGVDQARQFAVLVRGDGIDASNRTPVAAVHEMLRGAGIPDRNITSVSSWEALANTLTRLGKTTSGRDQVLIYYSGPGTLSRAGIEPVLLFPKAASNIDALPVGNLIREASDLPSASVLLDIDYVPTPVSDPTRSTAPGVAQATGAPWLRGISEADSVELAYTNPVFGSKTAVGGFTDDFIRRLTASIDSDGCDTFAKLAQNIAAANAQERVKPWPVFYTHMPTSFRFCRPTAVRQELAVRVLPGAADGDSRLRVANVTVPPIGDGAAAPFELTVDGVPVQRAPGTANVATDRVVPVGLGRHLIGVSASLPTGGVRLSNTIGSETADFRVMRSSNRLTAEFVRNAIPMTISDTAVTLPFLIGDRDGRPVRFQVRNNGVVIWQEIAPNTSKLLKIPVTRKIPLAIGVNNIVVEVERDNVFAMDRTRVVRRRSEPVRAVIVGIDDVAGAPALRGAIADARRMNDLLLRYTDAVPSRIKLLTGSNATRQAIVEAINEIGAIRAPNALAPRDGLGETFLFYFAGYGLSIETAPGAPATRCLVPADFNPTFGLASCLATTEIDDALDGVKVGKSIVIADTSYDGQAEERGRTYRTFIAPDADWRSASGVDHPDRIFLVAGGSNSTALESADGGLFTRALERAIRGSLERADAESELSLADAYDLARNDTAILSNRRQVPLMKGVLSAPFAFVRRAAAELKQEAGGIVRAARSDTSSMRPLDSERLARALLLYDKVLAIDPTDADAWRGRAHAALLAGNVDEARRLVDQAFSRPSTDDGADATWVLLRAEIEMRSGQLDSAIADAARVPHTAPSHAAATVLLGLLYSARGDSSKAVTALQSLLSGDNAAKSELTDEDLGRILLHTYLNFRRLHKIGLAKLLLNSFSNTYRGRGWLLRTTYRNPVVRRVVPGRSRVATIGPIQAPWSFMVAQFLRKGTASAEQPLNLFIDEAGRYDPRDPQAFSCMLHFYKGMARLLEHKTKLATSEFEQVVATDRVDLAEYWSAKIALAR